MTRVSGACPFSNKLCKECPIYIGRHSQICKAARHLKAARPKPTYGCAHLKFEFPQELIYSNMRLKDLEEREENLTEAKIVWKSQTE
ncbi:MAG: hypothetical protein LBQ00_06425 [Syntrophobacterales bacterium]|jgi:hypothetical protein|nr:hypothetical protein [Syntrophobacterales bacterium]